MPPQSDAFGTVVLPLPLVSPPTASSWTDVKKMFWPEVPIARNAPFVVSEVPGSNLTTTPGWMMSVTPALIEIEFLTQNTLPTTVPVGPQVVLTPTLVVIWMVWADAGPARARTAANAATKGARMGRTSGAGTRLCEGGGDIPVSRTGGVAARGFLSPACRTIPPVRAVSSLPRYLPALTLLGIPPTE